MPPGVGGRAGGAPADGPRWRGLTAGEWTRLVAWKALAVGTRAAERAGALDRLAAQSARWGERWAVAHATEPLPVAAWLGRPGAGRLWVDAAAAPAWAAGSCTDDDRALADRTADGIVELLGAGPVRVGAAPSARLDLYTGREWPLEPAWGIRLARGDGSDVRTCWEQSRGYPIIALARAYWTARDDAARTRYRDAFAGLVTGWIRGNPPGLGPNWATPMDLALRACNWAVGAALFARAPGLDAAFWGALLANLRLTAGYVGRHLEWHPKWRGNHFVSNLVGLVYVGALFRDDRHGARWLRRGSRALEREIRHQVHPDGTAFEAALGYHRLDTELFAWAAEVIERNVPGAPSPAYRDRLRGMYAFLEAYLPPDGLAPLMGDADDGRVHGASAAGLAEPRAHRLGLPERWWPDTAGGASAAFPDGGFYVLRAGADHAVVRCGAVGLAGAGSHDHNDLLSFDLSLGGRPVVADSGTYAYTRDLDARFRFRATAAHSVVQLGDEEQNPILPTRPWRVLADRARASSDRWEVHADGARFSGSHHGYAHRSSGAVVRRDIDAAPGTWRVEDVVDGEGEEDVVWRLHLAPGIEPHLAPAAPPPGAGPGTAARAVHAADLPGAPHVRVHLEVPATLTVALERSECSPAYGLRRDRACLVARGRTALPARILLRLTVAP